MYWNAISEWKEPVKVSGWVNVYRNPLPSPLRLHASKETADSANEMLWEHNERLACIFVQGTEGEEPNG